MDAEGSSQSQLKIPDATARESSNSSALSNQIDVGEYEYNEGGLKKAKLQSMLRVLLDDPLLSDVPKNPTLADVDTLLSLELGSAMRLSVLKLDGTSFEVTVMNSATVKDLKLAIKKKVNDMEQSGLGHRHISWKHVWANYCLAYHNNKLLHDDDPLQNFGIRNNSQVKGTQVRLEGFGDTLK
ncbi:U11/U12 small nuclear ribonucleoprotein 25 kDa protein isoform X4 [Arachis hypogaea]|uniref:U11/U12 small nuclear ribonucleoprotein 25 kDa protein isoform X4 n=1 Tax=Arachis hypogaea TaxID=3818 RepID=UPI003B20C087